MADEQYRWLDRETAESLLRGESLEAVDAASRDQAERLAKTLGALSVEPSSVSAELPGEAAALAAFRTARSDRAGERAALGHPTHTRSSDAGLVRIARHASPPRRPRWGRPVRFGLSAALAVGMVGGVAVAAGIGVLPTPFGDDEPGPAASVSAAVTPERPLTEPSGGTSGTGSTTPGSTGGGSGGDASREAAGGGSDTGDDKDNNGSGDKSASRGDMWSGAPSACSDMRDGKELGASRKHTLESEAGGSSHVWTYCKGVLSSVEDTTEDESGNGNGQSDDEVQGEENGNSGDEQGIAPGGGNDHHGDGVSDSPSPSSPSSYAPFLPRQESPSPEPSPESSPSSDSAQPTPSPTYSAL